jgi:hypothetical protein
MVDRMRRRVIQLDEGRIVRDERSGRYRPDRVLAADLTGAASGR